MCSSQTTAQSQTVETTTPEANKTAMPLPTTAKRSNLSASLHEDFSELNVREVVAMGSDATGTDQNVEDGAMSTGSISTGTILFTQSTNEATSPMSMQSVMEASGTKTTKQRIIGVVLYIRLKNPKSSVPISIDHLKSSYPSLSPFVDNLLPSVDDNTYATRDRVAECDNELAGECRCVLVCISNTIPVRKWATDTCISNTPIHYLRM